MCSSSGTTQQHVPSYEESLALVREMGNQMNLAICLEGLAAVAMAAGAAEASLWATQLWGEAQSLRKAMGAPIPPVDRASYERSVASARAQLGEKAFAQAWAQGQRMIPEQILAVQGPTMRPEHAPCVAQPTMAKTAPFCPAGLMAREVEVLRLVAQELTDCQVAEKLVLSPRTVNWHLTSIYSKLQVSSRNAATRFAIEHKLV